MPELGAEFYETLKFVGFSDAEIAEAVKEANGNTPIRQLNDSERTIFAGAVARAVQSAPYFRHGLSMLRPYKDATSSTIYTDKFARVGIGAFFFHPKTSTYFRAAALIHETMHVLSHHFTREPDVPLPPMMKNVAQDFEINTTLSRIAELDLGFMILPEQEPWKFPPSLSYEQYAVLIHRKSPTPPPQPPQSGSGDGEQDESGEEGSESSDAAGSPQSGGNEAAGGTSQNEDADGSGSGAAGTTSMPTPSRAGTCDESSTERSDAADKAGIDKASPSEQSVARKNTQAEVDEERKKAQGRGDRSMLAALNGITIRLQPSKANWRGVIRKVVARTVDKVVLGRSDYTYRRVSRRLSGSPYIFPGMVQYEPSGAVAIDTSGSMTNDDFNKAISEVHAILQKVLKNGKLSVFSVDAQSAEAKQVRSIKDIRLRGGGGTDMSIAVKKIIETPRKKRPDILVVFTDGGTSWDAVRKQLSRDEARTFTTVFAITLKEEYKNAAEKLRGLAEVIDLS